MGAADIKALEKDRIRQRYKGIDPDILETIPAVKKRADFYDDEPQRVAVYVRVSTDDPRQTSSYELQKNYYEDMVQRHESWTLVNIYADEGISGTSLNHRDAFNRMIKDCKTGSIDMIITKSVSRFARNIVDCISIVRDLASLPTPVGVFFESEHIFTLKDDSEMALSFLATIAQEESHVKSSIMNASIEMRFSHGIVLTPVLLGYDQDDDGMLVINEEEAKTVRLIFFMYLYGYTCEQIADVLTKLGCKTKKGNTTWSVSTVVQQLRNERHCGEVLAHKTFTPSYLNHKSKKNVGDRPQYRWRDHHEAIISRDDFIAVQHLLDNAKYGNKGILPEIQVIKSGALKGFISVNPRWGAFTRRDYEDACMSVYEDTGYQPPDLQPVEAHSGDFDFRDYEIARTQFFSTTGKLNLNFNKTNIKSGIACIQKLDNTLYIELLVHPVEKLIAIRKSEKNSRNAIRWARLNNRGKVQPHPISGTAFMPILYELFGWQESCRYRLCGVRRQKGSDTVLLFDVHEAEALVPPDIMPQKTSTDIAPLATSGKTAVIAYPSVWADTFGSNYYQHAQSRELAAIDRDGRWQVSIGTSPFSTTSLAVTPPDMLISRIQNIIRDIRQE